eukprot:3265422-Pleurochrysis_carterae.AAC.4
MFFRSMQHALLLYRSCSILFVPRRPLRRGDHEHLLQAEAPASHRLYRDCGAAHRAAAAASRRDAARLRPLHALRDRLRGGPFRHARQLALRRAGRRVRMHLQHLRALRPQGDTAAALPAGALPEAHQFNDGPQGRTL